MSIRVTIGVCAKDAERTIRQSVESIIAQKYPSELIQLVVVDGCSKDNTLSIIRSATSKRAGMIVETYSDKGEGLGTARQIVINHAEGKYVIFVDADVILFNDFVRNHVEFMERNPDVSIASAKSLLIEGSLIATIWDLANYATELSGLGGSICRLEALQQVGGFDTKIRGASEDRDLLLRFQLNGLKISINRAARCFHRRRENLCLLWNEQSWFGYGDHYLVHKHGSTAGPVWLKLPVVELNYSLKLASKTYEETGSRLSFLLLPIMIFGDLAWWTGFAKAHKNEYGH